MRPTLIMSGKEFSRSVKLNRLFVDLERAFFEARGSRAGRSERDSWTGSLPRLSDALELAELPEDIVVGLEVQIPYYSGRVDAAIFGHDAIGEPSVVLIELKQWSELQSGNDAGLYVRMRNGLVSVAHPSHQVDGYRQHLSNFVRAFQNEPRIKLTCCAYAHNYPERSGPLFGPPYTEILGQIPMFCAADVEQFADFLRAHMCGGRGAEIADRIRREGVGPSRSLADRASDAIHRQDVFTMLDEQILAQRSIASALDRAIRAKTKSIILVEGGPGTGKSVIALDALGRALRKGCGTFLVSGSSAFTNGMRRVLGPDLAPLVRFTDFFWKHDENAVDVMIVDEAHRIRNRSEPKVIAALRPQISQLEELVRAARVTVLFMDTNQIIEPDEVGDPEQVETLARRLGIRFARHRLSAQFRCDGSDTYLRWADALFGLTESDETHVLRSPATFDFDVMDTPHEVLAWVRYKNSTEPNSARLTAGWCWPWSDPAADGALINDIAIGDFVFPWELKNGKRGKPGVPEAKHWAIDAGGAEQAGTVYSVQGFEFRNVGVLMGPDLVIRDGQWVANPRANFRNSIRAKTPAIASIYLRRIYRALLTRPQRSVRVFSVDAETREFIRSRVEVLRA